MKHFAEMIEWMALLALIALCAGEPDLLDAIRDWIARQP